MARDIEEFLRRAAERRKQKAAGQNAGQNKPQPPRPAQAITPPVAEPVRRLSKPLNQQQPVERMIIEDSGVEVVRQPEPSIGSQGVAEHVSQHIDTSDISEHVSHLGERIVEADKKIDRRLNRTFDHDLGSLADRPTVQSTVSPEDDVANVTSELIKMLMNPKSVKHAILMSEILKRPNFDD